MIPVNIEDSHIVEIAKSKYRDYYNSEIFYLRKSKVKQEIINKIDNIFKVLNNKNDNDYVFFKSLCCDFKLLEKKSKEWKEHTKISI